MTRDYYKLEPDKVHLLPSGPNQHFTNGRGGAKIQFITRHHLMYIGEVEDVVDRIWNTRRASAHIIIGPTGRWGQAVWDRDTAWANANSWANARTIAIEHSNNTGKYGGNDYHNKSWNISNETLITGARVAAAYCLYFGLGRPVYGKNIRDHSEFTATGCPVHLTGPHPKGPWGGRAGKYHQQWMDEAQRFYDQLVNKSVNKDGTPKAGSTKAPAPTKGNEVSFTDEDRKMLREVHHELTGRFDSRYDLERLRQGRIDESQVFDETAIGYALEADRKIEDMHANMVPAIWKKIGEIADYLAKK
ncbi:peptidoglycan recognition protein family protein [Corynebacterium cystitidis]|uniref:peptidoglycan recognition protein family protein n=1 Tax=Corynebacterium cystitidis TaxID=35757 RepID=UPI00211DF44A|nr:N-acetylmuramoyl-L-alanine amidase [Corynebacterium cystitidis]